MVGWLHARLEATRTVGSGSLACPGIKLFRAPWGPAPLRRGSRPCSAAPPQAAPARSGAAQARRRDMQAGAGCSGAMGPQPRSPPRSVRGPLGARARVAPGPPALAGTLGRPRRHRHRRETAPPGSSSSRGSSSSNNNRSSSRSSRSRNNPGLRLRRHHGNSSNNRSSRRASVVARYPALLG